jgi:hypothetical protein
MGGKHPNAEAGLVAYEQCDYLVDSAYHVTCISRRTIEPEPHPERGPLPADLQAQFAERMSRFGREPAPYESLRSPNPRHR